MVRQADCLETLRRHASFRFAYFLPEDFVRILGEYGLRHRVEYRKRSLCDEVILDERDRGRNPRAPGPTLESEVELALQGLPRGFGVA